MCNISQPDFVVCRHGAITKALQAITKPLRVVTQGLRSRYQLLPVVTEPLRSGLAPRSLPYNSSGSGLTLSRMIVGVGHVSPAPTTGGLSTDSPSPKCMRQAPRQRSGPGAPSWGYYSTIVRILHRGVLPGRRGLFWPAPPSRPLRPPTFSRTGGLAVPPARGCAPCTLLGDGGGVVFSPGASRPPS